MAIKIISDKAIVIGLDKIFLADYPDLKVLGVNCTGLDHLDWDGINKRKIKVISLKDYPEFLKEITSTAEHTIGLILSLIRNYKTALNAPYKDREAYIGHTLSGKTLGLVGFGRVAHQVAKMAKGFGMAVLTVDKNEPPIFLSKLLRESDIVSLHIPLQENEGFFTKEMFKMMKPTSIIINTSRDKIIEKGALLWALNNGIISGAGIDFIDDEELVGYSLEHNNLILTNHQGGNTKEDLVKTEDFITKIIINYL